MQLSEQNTEPVLILRSVKQLHSLSSAKVRLSERNSKEKKDIFIWRFPNGSTFNGVKGASIP